MRKLVIGAAVAGVVLALAAATGVSAYWQARERIDLSATSSGDLDIDVVWQGGTEWSSISPGTTISKRAVITVNGAGRTLRARVTGTASNATAFDSAITRSIRIDDCTGTPGALLPASGYPADGALRPGDQLTVCVRYTLASDASATLRNADLTPSVAYTVVQVGAS